MRRFDLEGHKQQLFVTDEYLRGRNVSLKSAFAKRMLKKVSVHTQSGYAEQAYSNPVVKRGTANINPILPKIVASTKFNWRHGYRNATALPHS